MIQNFLALNDVRIVTGMAWETVPSEQLFATQGKPVELGPQPWNLEQYTGPESDHSKCVILRAQFTAQEDGWYVLGAGADWWLQIRLDEVLVLDNGGNWPTSIEDHSLMVELKQGSHTLDINFSRGTASASLACAIHFYGKNKPYDVDLEQRTGRIRKELHGANTTLTLSSRALHKYDEPLKKLNFTFARTHDWALWNAGQRIIDTHFIFPLMNLEPSDPANYYFAATDEIIRMTQEDAGMEVFYRLGSSIEHSGEKHFNVVPPEDPEKYAEVLAGIVRHYTRGWANGFHYNIRYWEIWNEPESMKNMWTAPYETFIPFFVTVLKRLKSEFPELQFGGPAMGCPWPWERFRALLDACRNAGVIPDFISWHCYAEKPETPVRMPYTVRAFLEEMGLSQIKLCINEWHYVKTWVGLQYTTTPEEYRNAIEGNQGIDSGVFNLAVLAGWQDSPLDLGMWYGASWDSPAWGYRNHFREFTKNYYSMELFGRFLKDYTVKLRMQSFNYYMLAGCSEDGNRAGILIPDFKGLFSEIQIRVNGLSQYRKISALILDETRNNEAVPVTVDGSNLILKKAGKGSAAFLVMLEK